MSIETELKFLDVDFKKVRKRLRALGMSFKKSVFEKNIVFDTPDRSLRKSGTLLRLRKDDANILTLKLPAVDAVSMIKTREEIETRVSDFENMTLILGNLGFTQSFVYEKIRETWIVGACKVCLDTLPFGDYIEIEGTEAEIIPCAVRLELDTSRVSNRTYHELNREYLLRSGLPLKDDFVFSDDFKKNMML